MVCEKCGSGQSSVVMVRSDTNGNRVRRRLCKHCGHRFWTVQGTEKVIRKYDLHWFGSSKTHTEEVTYRGDKL